MMGLPEEHKQMKFIPHFPKSIVTEENVISPMPLPLGFRKEPFGKKSP
jgi:hypothetical protein